MSEKPKRLNEVLETFAPQGANDRRWHFVEHQLEQTVISARAVVGALAVVRDRPENDEERQIAEDCLSYAEGMLCDILKARASFVSYLSGTPVLDKISRKEL